MTTLDSTLVSNFEATPVVMTDASLLTGVTRIAQGTLELAAGDSTDNDIVMLAPIPTGASITSLKIGTDTFGNSCTFNVGLYTSAGVVKDEDCFATSVADAGAMTDVRFEAADLNTGSKKLWELAGDSTDPGGYFYVAITFNATGGTAGTLAWNINYVVN